MKTYDDKPISDIKWTNYKIIVPTQEDKEELEEAFEHIHYSDIDTNYVTVNQLIHEYLTPERSGDPATINNIIVDTELFKKLQQPDFEQKELTSIEVFEKTFQDLEDNGYVSPHQREEVFLEAQLFFASKPKERYNDQIFFDVDNKMKTFQVSSKRTLKS